MNTKIPKKIHQLWVGDLEIPKHLKQFTDSMSDINPGYECTLWGNEVFERYSDDPFLKNYLKNPDLYRWAFICDRVRCLLLNDIGGIYVDADAKPIQSFDLCMNQLGENITFFTGLKPTQKNNTLFDCAVYGSAPKSRMIKHLLSTYQDINWANGCKIFSDRIIREMGPDIGCFGYEYFYDQTEGDKTIVLHDVEETRLFSWTWDDEQSRRENW